MTSDPTPVPVAPVWPDDATVEKARAAVLSWLGRETPCMCGDAFRSRNLIDPSCCYHEIIRNDGDADLAEAVLSVVAEDMALLAAVRQVIADTEDEMEPGWRSIPRAEGYERIAALLAGGDR